MSGGHRGRQGRKPKASTIVERLRGENPVEPELRRMPSAPAHLSEVAKAEWRRVGRLLRDAGLLSDLDTTALALYCSAYADYVDARAMLQGPVGFCPNCDPREGSENPVGCNPPFHLMVEYGRVFKGRLGKIVPSPYVAIHKQSREQMVRLLGEFGMTPASRSRIPKKKEPDRRPPRSPRQPDEDKPPEEGPDPRAVLGWPVQAEKN